MATIYRIVSQDVWNEAQARGVFHGTEHDVRDGFIHFSAAHQVVETARKHYALQHNLLLLYIDDTMLQQLRPGALKWEVSRGGDKFPHLYADLPVNAVQRVETLPLSADGQHIFPELPA